MKKQPELFSGKDLYDLEKEREFQGRVIETARLMGWRVYSIPDSRRATLAGFPDLLLWRVKDKRFLFAELKREKGRLSKPQEAVLEELRLIAQGVREIEVHVWRPSDWDRILLILR